MDRRRFLQSGTLAGGALFLSRPPAGTARAEPAAGPPTGLPPVDDPQYLSPVGDPAAVPRFVNPLPRPSRLDLRRGGRHALRLAPAVRDLLGGGLGLRTPVWGFGPPGGAVAFPGPTLIARSGRPTTVNWLNHLPRHHLLPVDPTLHQAFSHSTHTIARDGVPAVVHLHGGHTDADSDGHPDAWYTARGVTGPRFSGSRYSYANSQEAATLWYHDHTLGLTRLNVYAGLAGFYLLRDRRERELITCHRLPDPRYERELVIQDRMFHPDGRLAYPDAPAASPAWPGGPSIRPEFFGQVLLVNGRAWPCAAVEPRQYRLRLLNGSNSRFYRLSLDGGRPVPVTLIGTDDGFLHRPLPLTEPLVLAPGERADLVADFRGCAGATFDLGNDAPTPFPDGTPVLPPADKVLRFQVTRPYDARVPEPRLPAALRPGPFRVPRPVTRTRRLLLFEGQDAYGRPKPLLGTVERGTSAWDAPVTETPRPHTAEIWEFFNTTSDTHPIHLHLVSFQVLGRAAFTADQDPAGGALSNIRTEPPEPPDGTETGPKDTVQAPPGRVTRVKAFFDRCGTYVWHCHMLEHEDHEMMRNFQVR
ncbi:multicopper oxidase family protein [Streptomyces zingiberis]|uniref:Multicopper oxidase domain-containing protein n=1 Tax=Streptomyces zingiberis TaxID=2053010 RepID=A0ABX1BXH1_9ACTN|nr:multicopper oxidase [Streptomyces zingiberis]NJQ00009.1 multicopper oxidase domain-containing protein [Streptomyces zingiberis]